MTPRLEDLGPCFQGVVPAMVATCALDGEPNITYLSQVYYVDPKHVALSRQFFNKTQRNVAENPYATVLLWDPVTFDMYRLLLRFDHSETDGPLFDTMSLRIEVIASHTGMAGIFKLVSADVYEVLSIESVDGFLTPPDPALDALPPPSVDAVPISEVRGLQAISGRISRATHLEELLDVALLALDETFGFSHSMVLLPDDSGQRLVTVASRGYGEHGVGAEVTIGDGIIGTVAVRQRMVRVAGMDESLRYGRAIRHRAEESGQGCPAPEIPLPGLCDAQAHLALPLCVGRRLVGVLGVESRDPLCFDEWDEAYLQIIGNQIALGIDRMQAFDDADDSPSLSRPPQRREASPVRTRRSFVYYRNDDCVFMDGEYLVRNIPGKILWRVLVQHERTGQSEFTNRELRLDPTLGLPAVKDNLESRLILLRRRLEEKCPDVRLVPVRRGRFALELGCDVALTEKDSAGA